MINRMFLAGAASVLAASAAQAADLEAPAVYDWSGVYGGIFAGVGFSSSDWRGSDDDSSADPVAIDEKLDDTAAVLGALAGINVQHDRLVFGLEADIAWFGSKEDESLDGAEGLDIVSDIDLLGSLRARLGYAADRTLFYVTGGLAFADAKHSWDDGGSEAFNLPKETVDLDFGWAAGAGIEHAWTDNWLVRIEGLYFDLGSENGEAANEEEADTFKVDQEIFVGRIGISYKFD